MNGALVIDKPSGPSSHDVVARVRRALGVSRIGHTGTLDPLATGVLPLLVGRATRLARFLTASDKIYEARIRLGVATDTYDATGRRVATAGARHVPVERAAIEHALTAFRGVIRQVPPPFSAKKIGGVRAYALARRQTPVEPAPVAVSAHALDILRFEGTALDLRVGCSSGFYVRSLAHDLGVRLGCGAHLEHIRRIRAGQFHIEEAVPLEIVEQEGPDAAARLVGPERLLPELPVLVLSDRGAARAAHGHAVTGADLTEPPAVEPIPAEASKSTFRLLDRQGRLVAIGERRCGRVLHPVVVLV